MPLCPMPLCPHGTAHDMVIERTGSPKLVLLTVLGPDSAGAFFYRLIDIAATRAAWSEGAIRRQVKAKDGRL